MKKKTSYLPTEPENYNSKSCFRYSLLSSMNWVHPVPETTSRTQRYSKTVKKGLIVIIVQLDLTLCTEILYFLSLGSLLTCHNFFGCGQNELNRTADYQEGYTYWSFHQCCHYKFEVSITIQTHQGCTPMSGLWKTLVR